MSGLSYAVVTPVRDDDRNLRRLARCLVAQAARPDSWLIVDTGSADDTLAIAEELAQQNDWIRVLTLPDVGPIRRGGPIVRAFHMGVAALDRPADVVVKLDADVSMRRDFFERLLKALGDDPRLGIASGSAYERSDMTWRQRYGTRGSVWGPVRAYRWDCLQDVLPLEERMGWDGIDEFKARLKGWKTGSFLDLPFRHNRREGDRDATRGRAWQAQGEIAHYTGYRISYLMLRAAYRARQEPAALFMLLGYAKAAMRREPRYADRAVRDYLREHQRLREIPVRALEARGRTGKRSSS